MSLYPIVQGSHSSPDSRGAEALESVTLWGLESELEAGK